MQSINRQVFNLVLLEYRCSGQDPATFSIGCEEENAIRYASGYVAMKIMKEFQKKEGIKASESYPIWLQLVTKLL